MGRIYSKKIKLILDIELMQTGDNLDYFKKYHVSAKKFVRLFE